MIFFVKISILTKKVPLYSFFCSTYKNFFFWTQNKKNNNINYN